MKNNKQKHIPNKEQSSLAQPKLSEEQIQRIEELKQQIQQKNYLTNEQADKLAEQWLNK